jgi:hypothetical protein
MNSSVNWIDFVFNLFDMCSFLLFMCLITSVFLINFSMRRCERSKMQPFTVNYCVKNPGIIILNMSSKWQRWWVVTESTLALVQILLEHILFFFFIRIHQKYWLILLDLLDRFIPRMDQSFIQSSREPWITDWWFCV